MDLFFNIVKVILSIWSFVDIYTARDNKKGLVKVAIFGWALVLTNSIAYIISKIFS